MVSNDLKVFLSSISVNLMALIAGIGYSWSSPCTPKLRSVTDPDNNPLGRQATLEEISWITSLHALGSLIGPLFTGIVSKSFGKKITLIIFSLSQLVSSLILIFAFDVKHFYVARFLLGIGTGSVFSVIPSFVGEISPTRVRGRTSMLNSVLLTAGQTLVLIVGPFVTIRTIAFMTIIIYFVFLTTFSYFVPQSPYDYVMRGRPDKAKATLRKWGRRDSLEKELLEIVTICEESSKEQSLKTIFKSTILKKCLLISLGLVSLQSLVGNPAIVAYQQTILDLSKNSTVSSDIFIIIISVVQLIGTYFSTTFVDRWGRKRLLIISYLGLFVPLAILGFYFFLLERNFNLDFFFWIPFTSILIYILFYKIGAGPLPWTLSGEIFPPSFKPLLSTITVFCMTLVNFLVTLIFPFISVYLGTAFSIWSFAVFSLISLIYISLFVPETKGKSLMEIQKMLLGEKNVIKHVREAINFNSNASNLE
ncbi:facilitated trehalose transporter Tret1-2 homolog [Diorhabda carinulata]|uniref:facilitated trehalose transporter Tret1-2 homolog n=1 Tax=Diorhabda carinulata TaxID=1163345 RepID=UPI0025A0AA11|nr:facilitated trehalose transporter Tret1-2 homolog [Diorhabda carinulata]